MRLHIIDGQKIRSNHDYPPIPYRNMDWSATSDNYDASYEEGRWVASHPVGYGPTEQEAIRDYLDQIEETA